MNPKGMLISIFLMPAVFTSCCQDSTGKRIEQLKETWLQKAEELSALGQKIGEKYELMEGINLACHFYLKELCSNLEGKEKEDMEQTFDVSLENFNRNFVYAFGVKGDVKGFIVNECIDEKEKNYGSNVAKISKIRLMFEQALVKKLIEQYEKLVQELVEIDQELVGLLGEHPMF
jgi:hypothetical protein